MADFTVGNIFFVLILILQKTRHSFSAQGLTMGSWSYMFSLLKNYPCLFCSITYNQALFFRESPLASQTKIP